MAKPKIAIIVSTTRDTRFADKPAQWLLDKAKAHDDLSFEIVDIKDFDLPFFNEAASNMWMPSEDPKAIAWQKKIAEFDGYIFVTAEYNHSVSGALKNAIDQAYNEWVRKPAAFLGYGGVGAARAIEHLRGITVELQMAPVRQAVHIGGGEFMKVHPLGENGSMDVLDPILAPAAKDMIEHLSWWTYALKSAREEGVALAAE